MIEFAGLLKDLRKRAGDPSLRWMEDWGRRHPPDGGLKRSSIEDKLKGKTLPTERFVEQFVAACAAWARSRRRPLPDRFVDAATWRDRFEDLLLRVESARDNARRSADASRKLQALAVPRHLPPTSPFFVARDRELATLDRIRRETVGGPGSAPIAVISGVAGSGKSTLALRWAHSVAAHFPDGQLYLNLRQTDGGPLPVEEIVRALLEALGQEIPVAYDAQLSTYRTVLFGQRVLIVLDNAASAEQVRSLLPAGAGCFVLVTCRRSLDSLVAVDGAHRVSLPAFTPQESRALLELRLGAPVVTADAAATAAVVEFCAGLPLALNIAAALAARHTDPSLARVAALAEPGTRLLVLDLGDDAGRVRTIFRLAYAQLDPHTARVFRLLGVHPGPVVTTAVAASLAGVRLDVAAQALGELADQHLLQERQSGQYGFHDLLREYAAEVAAASDTVTERHDAVRRALDHYLRGTYAAGMLWDPLRDPLSLVAAADGVVLDEILTGADALAWLRRQYPALLRAVHLACDLGFDVHAWQLAWTMADFLSRQGYWHDWAALHERALTAARRAGDQGGEARLRRGLGRAYARLERLDESDEQLDLALGSFASLVDLAGLGHTHIDLSRNAELRKDFTAALELSRRAADCYAAAGQAAGEANALNGVGWYSTLLGEHDLAVQCCERALSLLRALGDRSGQAATLDSLGLAYFHLGELERAEGHLRDAIALFAETVDPAEQAGSLTRLADVHLAAGRPEAAREAMREAAVLFEAVGDKTSAELIGERLRKVSGNPSDTPRAAGSLTATAPNFLEES